jgi:hypothetical protein
LLEVINPFASCPNPTQWSEINNSMDNVYVLSVLTNSSDQYGATAKNSVVFDAGTTQETTVHGASVADMRHEADPLAHPSHAAGADFGSGSASADSSVFP